ncbi:MAG TPA: hypothetical protein EYN66_09075 [Myxococcales bacterium]|nr:hypothetical protein [Myxococcales bacterium]
MKFEDPIQENLSATSFGAQVGLSYLVRRIARFHLMNEVNTSRIETLQYRVFALVDLELWL